MYMHLRQMKFSVGDLLRDQGDRNDSMGIMRKGAEGVTRSLTYVDSKIIPQV